MAMDAAAFEWVFEAFPDFHAYFSPLFGRWEWREHGRHYVQALLVQSQDRHNAENLSESVGIETETARCAKSDSRSMTHPEA